MAISNGSFETGTAIVGGAQYWTSSASTACSIVGFDDEEKPFEEFNWGDYTEEISGTIAIFNSLSYESFIWGSGDFIDEWYSGWTNSTEDEFNWGFDDIWSGGASTGIDDFSWGSFDDTWTAGAACTFDSGVSSFETFEDSGWA
jgi:hypothetical protein